MKSDPDEIHLLAGDQLATTQAQLVLVDGLINGKLELSDDNAKLDEVWNAVASSWFEGGERDPDVRLLKFTMSEAEVWTTAGRIGFFYEIAKSKITGTKPDTGDHFTVSF